jgi:hypothetical protein
MTLDQTWSPVNMHFPDAKRRKNPAKTGVTGD